jgi:hypothetical protein
LVYYKIVAAVIKNTAVMSQDQFNKPRRTNSIERVCSGGNNGQRGRCKSDTIEQNGARRK